MGLHSKSRAEKVGFWLTIICGIHCIATPVLITLLPMVGSKFEVFHRYETIFLYFSLFLAVYLMWKDKKKHNNPWPLEIVVVAMCLSILFNYYLGKSFEIYTSLLVALLIITAYLLNWKHKEKCHCEQVH